MPKALTATAIPAKRKPIFWTSVVVRLRDLKPWGRNPRYSTRAQAERILASFAEYGQVQTVAIGPGGEVYDGHQRLGALLTVYGGDYEIAARRSSRALTTSERERLVILLHAGAVGAWDQDILAGFDDELVREAGFNEELLEHMRRDEAAIIARTGAAEDEPPPTDEDVVEGDYDDRSTEHTCPNCGYTWSGKKRGGGDGDADVGDVGDCAIEN